MPDAPLHALLVTAGIALAACAHSAPSAREATMSTTAATSSVDVMPVKEWPLRFKSHSFQVACYDTYGCSVYYASLQQWEDGPDQYRQSSASYGPDYQRNWNGTHAMIRNFPPPAVVTWRSKDGQAHKAEIDIGDIFKDELIRHSVPREEIADMPDGVYDREPAIILEINDRTIRVWMRAMIFTKDYQIPGNQYSDFRDDLVLAKTYTY